jgi:hypothetical protein
MDAQFDRRLGFPITKIWFNRQIFVMQGMATDEICLLRLVACCQIDGAESLSNNGPVIWLRIIFGIDEDLGNGSSCIDLSFIPFSEDGDRFGNVPAWPQIWDDVVEEATGFAGRPLLRLRGTTLPPNPVFVLYRSHE